MKKIFIAFLFLAPCIMFSQTLTLDTSFTAGNVGPNNVIISTALQDDGKIIIGGDFTQFNGEPRSCIARLNADGSLDESFSIGNGFTASDNLPAIQSVKVLPDGKILAAGWFTHFNGSVKRGIVRLNSNGSLDTTFTSPIFDTDDVFYSNTIYDIAVSTDGYIYIGGDFLLSSGQMSIARLMPDGDIDTSFSGSVGSFDSYPSVYGITIQNDGKIIVTGFFVLIGNGYSGFVRFNQDGSKDLTLTNYFGFSGTFYKSTVQADGKILLAGIYIAEDGEQKLLTRIHTDGSVDSSFIPVPVGMSGTAANRIENVYEYQGKLLIQGSGLSYFSGTDAGEMLLLNSDGTLFSDINTGQGFKIPNVQSNVRSLCVQPDNKIIATGLFTSYNGVAEKSIARLNGGVLDTEQHVFNKSLMVYKSNEGLCFKSDELINNLIVYGVDGKLLLDKKHINELLIVETTLPHGVLITKTVLSSGRVIVKKVFN